MKKNTIIVITLVALALLGTCKNAFVSAILSDKTGAGGDPGGGKKIGSGVIDLQAVTVGDASITVKVKLVQATNGQIPEYAIATISSVPASGWQDGGTFNELTPNTKYYVFARSKESDAYKAGSAAHLEVTTLAAGQTAVKAIVDFEDDAIGKTYGVTEGDSAPIVKVVNDPVNAGQKSLQITATWYNQAAIIPIYLTQELYKYQKFSFRLSVASGTDLGYKKVLVYAADTADKFVQYGFGNPANSQYPQFAANLVGETEEKDFSSITKNTWTDFEITISNPDDAIKDLIGNIYIAIGIQCEDMVYLLDDLAFTGASVEPPQPPVNPTGPRDDIVDFESAITVGLTKGNSSPTVAIVNDPGNSGQKSLQITASDYNQAAVIPITLSKELNKFTTVSFRFRLKNGTDLGYKRILVYAASASTTFKDYSFGNPSSDSNNFAVNLVGQTEEINIGDSHKNTWTNCSFTISNPNDTVGNLKGPIYLAIGINCSNMDYLIDDVAFTGSSVPSNPIPSLIDFEADALNKTYEFTRGQNSPTVKVVADPANGAQKSLQITIGGSDNRWNQAAIIPINLPKALSNYQSFTFRFYLKSGADPTSGEARRIQVYASANPADFKQGGFGNPSNSSYTQFAANLVAETDETHFGSSHLNKWTEYELPCNPGSAISSLPAGNIYIAIGINADINREYLLDDLTFSETSNSATITDYTPKTFDKKTSSSDYKDVTVTMDLKGNTLTSVKNGATTLTSGTNYTVSGSTVTIKKEYLATLAEGTASLTFTFSAGVSRTIAITIIDTTHSSISPASATFDLKTGNPLNNSITVNVTLNGNTLTGIKNGATTLNSGTDYTNSGNTVTINKSYLSTLTSAKNTTVTLTFEFNAGANQTMAISIIDGDDVRTEYVFNTTPIPSGYPKFAPTTSTSTTEIPTVSGIKVLQVNQTTKNDVMILQFNLGGTKLSDYASIDIKIRGLTSNDPTWKPLNVSVPKTLGGTFTANKNDLNIATQSNALGNPDAWYTHTSIPLTNLTTSIGSGKTAGDLTGLIEIGFWLTEANGSVSNPTKYQIEYVRLNKKP